MNRKKLFVTSQSMDGSFFNNSTPKKQKILISNSFNKTKEKINFFLTRTVRENEKKRQRFHFVFKKPPKYPTKTISLSTDIICPREELQTFSTSDTNHFSTVNNYTVEAYRKSVEVMKERKKKLNKSLQKPLTCPKIRHKKPAQEKQLNLVSKEEPVENYLNDVFGPIKKQIEERFDSNQKIVRKEITHTFLFTYPQIVPTEKFSSKHQYLSKYCNYRERPDIPFVPQQELFNLEIIKEKYKLPERLLNPVKPINKSKTFFESIQKRAKWKISLMHALQDLQNLKIKFSEAEKYIMLNPKPYEYENSKILFDAAKTGNFNHFSDLINSDRKILLSVDYSSQTVLHWLAKRNYYTMIPYALKKGAVVNARDSTGKTPLHIACEKYHLESALILLYGHASPFIIDNNGRTAEELAWDNSNEKTWYIKRLIQRAKFLYYVHSMRKIQDFDYGIQRGIIFVYNIELEADFDFVQFHLSQKKKQEEAEYKNYIGEIKKYLDQKEY